MLRNRLLNRVLCLVLSLAVVVAACGTAWAADGTEAVFAKGRDPYIKSEDFIGLKDAYKDYFKMGVAMPQTNSWYSANGDRAETVRRTFNSLTTENEFKPDSNFSTTSPTLYKAGSGGDAMLKFCHENGIKMRYHVLVWHSQINASIFGIDFKAKSNGNPTRDASVSLDKDSLVDRETLLERLKTYIYGAMEYVYSNGYAETVYAFDVVNEAVDESKDDGLRRSYWYQIIGPEFLYYSFLFAREAEITYSKQYASLYGLDPDGDLSSIMPKLFYNDYNEWFTSRVNIITRFTTETKWNENQSMVQSFAIKEGGDGTMLGDGLIDGIGMQGHVSDNQNIDEYIRALEKYSEAVGEVHITELDVGCTHTGENRWYYQAKFFYDLFTRLVEARENGVNLTSVTLWGLSDDATWRNGADPLVYFADLSKKPAYDALLLAAEKKEFTMTLADTISQLEDTEIDFEPYKIGSSTEFWDPAKAGFIARGTGHQPNIEIARNVNHTPDALIGLSLLVERQEQDATVMMDVSKFSGRNITFTVFVKTDDSKIRMGLETGQSTQLIEIDNRKEWNLISMNIDVPKGLTSAFLYFETDGHANMYIDDVAIIYTKDGEEPAPVQVDPDVPAPGTSNDQGKAERDDTVQTGTESGNADNSSSADSASAGKDDNKMSPVVPIAIVGAAAAAGVVVFFLKKRQK